ncbi:hypothetical protein GCM10028827_29810 [Mucilaginibacter myungsuensis]
MLQVGKTVAYCKSISELPSVTAKTVAEAAYAGDQTAKEVYKICGKQLGKALSVFIDLLNPELIIMGSIYGRAKALLEPHMMQVIEREAYFESVAACKIVESGLAENVGDMAALSLAVMSSTE